MNIQQKILAGKLFIYPTDTIYGLGCDATNVQAVEKIKEIKVRDKDKPLSIIAPSLDWIKQHLVPDVELEKYLPGSYTLILKKKNPEFLNHVSSSDTLGVRIPKHEFTKEIQKAQVPFITTSVNLSGKKPANKISEIKPDILTKADVVIDAGELSGKPSILVVDGKEITR